MRVADKLRETSAKFGVILNEIIEACSMVAAEGKNSILLKVELGGNLDTAKMIAEWAKREGFKKCVYDVTHGTVELEW